MLFLAVKKEIGWYSQPSQAEASIGLLLNTSYKPHGRQAPCCCLWVVPACVTMQYFESCFELSLGGIWARYTVRCFTTRKDLENDMALHICIYLLS